MPDQDDLPRRARPYATAVEIDPPKVLRDVRLLAEGLAFPEGPVLLEDGSLLVVELASGFVQRIEPDGTTERVANCGGGPNGAAIGPDGALYVCNNGGTWPDYSGGKIQRVNLETGDVDDLYVECDGVPLSAPNDIVFDPSGDFWFTDFGKIKDRVRDEGRIVYASPDGLTIKEVLRSLSSPNGIGLSPDGSTLYYSDTFGGRLYGSSILAPGQIEQFAFQDPRAVLCGLPGLQMFDSLAVDSTGAIAVGTLGSGCLTVVSPSGNRISQWWPPDPFEDSMPTNVCFGLGGSCVAYLTLASTGRVVSCEWPVPGLPLAYSA